MTKESQLLASFISDFRKGKKTQDPIKYAQICKDLVSFYGSPEDVAKKLGIGKETVRILSKVAELPGEIKVLISERKIPLTVAFDLIPLDSKLQIDTAKAIIGLSFKDARGIIRRVSENPCRPVLDTRAEALEEFERREVNLAIIAVPKEVYAELQHESKDVAQLVKRIVESWLDRKEKNALVSNPENENTVSVAVRFSRNTFRSLCKITSKPANLVEQIILGWSKTKRKKYFEG